MQKHTSFTSWLFNNLLIGELLFVHRGIQCFFGHLEIFSSEYTFASINIPFLLAESRSSGKVLATEAVSDDSNIDEAESLIEGDDELSLISEDSIKPSNMSEISGMFLSDLHLSLIVLHGKKTLYDDFSFSDRKCALIFLL